MVSKGRKFIIASSVDHMPPIILSLFLLCSPLQNCSARDTITFGNSISDETGETLISTGEIFELGFFTPNENSSTHRRYVGIWYFNKPRTVVWVANRDHPLSDGKGSFAIKDDGNLRVLDGKDNSFWSTGDRPLSSFKNTAAILDDSGNLILSDNISGETLWQSFGSPTDTFLPGMEMDEGLNLTSWKSSNDPAKGDFVFLKYQSSLDEFVIRKDTLTQYWKSEADQMPSVIADLLSNFSSTNSVSLARVVSESVKQQDAGASVTAGATNANKPAGCGRVQAGMPYKPCPPLLSRNSSYYSYTRLVMSFTGEIQYLRWDGNKNWSLVWLEPTDRCGALNACGNFGSCNINNSVTCKCLPGFEPNSQDNLWYGDFSGGCKRKSSMCDNTFLNLTMMNVRDPDIRLEATNEGECRDKICLVNPGCKCQAFSYDFDNRTCWIWTEDLRNLQEYAEGGRNLSVRVDISGIESTVRDCKPCGTYLIPYPLSTGRDCGDPMYMNFECNLSTGQVWFKAPNGTSSRVTYIYPDERKFSIQAKGGGNCEPHKSVGKIPPFHVNNWCKDNKGDSSSDMSSKGREEIEISWDPPLEPICNISSPADCKDWKNSTCKKARDGQQRCLCNAPFQWNSSTLSCDQGHSPWKMSRPLIISSVTVPIALICILVCCLYLRRRRAAKRKENKRKTEQNQALQFCDNELRGKDWIASNQFREEDKKDIDVPFFDLESILAATNNFSDENKLGRGGFGPVYKGTFPGGREIAVKRLLSVSGQGLEEFKNEVILIAKLQHRNLVRLLGYCVEGEEKLLLYEYMPNKSLDSFIFDRTLCMVLDWELRFNIILGIARGLLYLHQDSRLRIIHRDLKTSNILLDAEKNPKISDFGLARIFEGKQTDQEETKKVCGTYGYMSPEYANFGVISVKSDVFSFGVVILEIISGKRNIDFYHSEETLSLLGYAWRLWNEDKAIDLMDQTLSATCKTSEFLKCLNVGLLCVQEDPNDRPHMSKVFSMLDSETATLPTPKQPAFITSSSTPKTCSNNELTISTEEGR